MVEQTGSTNADLLADAMQGADEGSVLMTDHQTAGRGRQDRSWHDEPGNALLVSVLLRPNRMVAPLMPLLAGVAAVEAIATMAPGGEPAASAPVGLKWPNDVLAPGLSERKVAGILAEASTVPPRLRSSSRRDDDSIIVVVGMGLNLGWGSPPPPEIAERAATLTELFDRPVARDEVLDRYLRAMEYWLRRLEGSEANQVLNRYRHHCLTIGRLVRFATATAEYQGVVTEVTPSGTLMLETDDGQTVELHAGDAHHMPLG